MDIKKIQQIKAEIEGLILGAKQKALDSGTSISTPLFAKRINEIRTKLLKKFSISQEEYDNVDSLATREEIKGKIRTKEQIKKDIQEALDAENFRKNTEARLIELNIAFQRLGRDSVANNIAIEKVREGVRAFKPFNQEEIVDLETSQIKGYKNEKKEIAAHFEEVTSFGNQLERNAKKQEKNTLDIIKRLTDLEDEEIVISHRDLLDITPDDHHDEKHTLESHLDSPLMKKLLYVTSANFTKAFYQHMDGIRGGVIDIAGITQNDADERYVIKNGLNILNVGTATPTDPSEGDLWVDTN